jgi:hypothetical protein
MAEIIKVLGNEQAFTVANTFSSANTTSFRNLVRVVNSSNAAAVIVFTNTTSSSQLANLTVLPYTEVIVEKATKDTITASAASLLGTPIAFSQ